MTKEQSPYQVELVWNREFHFVQHGTPFTEVEAAIRFAKDMENSGDGERVKETRVSDSQGRVVWQYGQMI